jgi:ribonuclease D
MTHKDSALPMLVQTRDSFAALVADLGRQSRIGVDTESNSLHAYRERVCLMQFSTERQDYVLDPFAPVELAPLGRIFAEPKIEKIFHAAEYDIICLRRDFGFSFTGIFDTMQAGRILGRKLAGLDRLLEERFSVRVNKRLQKANWGRRPLTPELLRYAAQDTHYLIPLRDMLQAELRKKGLSELAQEDFRMACNHQEKPVSQEPPAWARLAARRDLTPRDRAVVGELLAWREATAARLDRPPFKVLGNNVLLAIARGRPSQSGDLIELGLGASLLQHWGNDIMAAVARGVRAPLVHKASSPAPGAAYLKRLEKLKAWRKKAAEGMQVESDVVLPRSLLLALAARGSKDMVSIMDASPWRLQRFGDQIAAALHQASP